MTQTHAQSTGKWVTVYHPTWWYGVLKPSMIDFSSMTHIAIFPAQDALATAPYFNSAGIDDGTDFPQIVTLAHAKGVKVLISAVGGYGQSNMPVVAADPVKCQAFVDAACAYAKSKNCDGIELDWEFPYATDDVGWNRMIRLFRQQLDTWSTKGVLATSMFYGTTGPNVAPYHVDSMMVFDQINLMSYTMWMGTSAGPFKSGYDTPINAPTNFAGYNGWGLNTASGPLSYITAGYPASKLGLGLSFEGTRFDGVTTLGQSYSGWGFTSSVTGTLSTSYAAIPTTGRVWDATAQANYCVSGTSVYSFQDTNSVKAIATWGNAKGFGGLMIYDLATGYDTKAAVPDAMLKMAGAVTLGTTPTVTAPTGTFTASPTTLAAGGGAVTLTWTSSNATSASIDQGVGTVAVSGSVSVSPTVTTTYTLTLANSAGTTQKYTATVTVAAAVPAPTGTLTPSVTSLAAGGGNVTLTWTSANAASASIDQGIGSVAVSGSTTVPLTATTTYTLTLTNSAGVTQTYSTTVTVAASVPVPNGTFKTSAATLPAGGGNVTLTWTSSNAATASIDQGVGTVAVSGTKTVAVTATTTFTLTLTNSAGVAQKYTVTVTVAAPVPAPTGTLTSSVATLAAGGGSVTLTWTSANAASASIDQGVGTVSVNGTKTLTVTATTTYTLTLTNSAGVTQKYSVTIAVAPTGTFTISTTTLAAPGGNVTLTWTSANATSASIDQGVGTVAVSGTKTLAVTATTTYTLTLTNSAGVTKTYTVTVTVVPAPTGTFSASATSLPAGGGTVTFTWTSTNAATASIDQSVGTVTLNGSKAVSVTSTKTFTLTLTNAAGVQAKYTVPITVAASVPAPTATLTVSPASLPLGGGAVTLTWTTTNAASASLDQGIGAVAVSGSTTVTVALSTTFNLTAVNSAGTSVTTSAVVTVASGATTSNPTLTVYNDKALVSPWTTTGSYSATINLNSTDRFVTGSTSIKVTASAWGGVKFRDGGWTTGQTIDPYMYDSIHVALHAGTTADTLSLFCEDATSNMIGNDTILLLPANTWVIKSIPLSKLNTTNTPFTTLSFQIYQSTSSTFYIDDLRLIGKVTSGNAATQALSLRQGWTMVSSYLQPNSAALGTLFPSMAGTGAVLKNSVGDVYWPDLAINTIGSWNPLNGYQLYSKAAQSVSFTGTVIDPAKSTVSLNAGMNVTPYLRSSAMTPATAFAGLAEPSIIVADESNNIYWPSQSVVTLTSLQPGHAYTVFVPSRKTFTYPANTTAAADIASDDEQSASTLAKHYATEAGQSSVYAMMLFISSAFKDGDEVAVRAGNGSVIGSGVCSQGKAAVTIIGDDPITSDIIEGAAENEGLAVEVWSALDQSGHTFIPSTMTDQLTKVERTVSRVQFNAGTVSIVNGTAPKTVPVSHMLEQNFPNPFNPSTSIRFAIAEQAPVKLTVYDILGRVVATLVNRTMAPGTYAVDWNAKHEPSGVYFYKLESGGYTDVKRMIFQK